MMKEKLKQIPLSKWILFGLIFIIIFINFNIKRWNKQSVIKWDVTSYYGYLPAYFIYDDISLEFVKDKPEYYYNHQMFWPKQLPNGNSVFKMTMGMSILYSPFFAIAHGYTKAFGEKEEPGPGFSVPYHIAIHLSCLFYLFIGLICLQKFLLNYFSDGVVATTLIFIVLGTNLLYYASTEPAMSHAYNFSLISILLYVFDRWFKNANILNTIIVGLLIGLLTLIRPINILLFLIALFYDTNNTLAVINNLKTFFVERIKWTIIIVVAAFLVVFPQFLYWKTMTGDWVFNSYIDEKFYFNNPHIIDGFFSFRKGWLLYTPIMSFSFIGFFFLFKEKKEMFTGPFFLFIIYTYVIFSWWCWWYGGSFGCRAMIDLYPILSIPLAGFITKVFHQKKQVIYVVIILSFFLVSLNLIQTFQYRRNLIHYDSMTKEAYFMSLIYLDKDPPNFKSRLKAPNYEKAKQGLEEW